MNSIRIINMRSLVDTGTIDLKPINMLVGSNSSGKSTFLRVFPLLKQSLYRRINGPIFWAGDEKDYVDFGSYKETINKGISEKENYIGLEFSIPYTLYEIARYSYSSSRVKNMPKKEAKIKIEISNKGNIDIISKIELTCDEDELIIDNIKNKTFFNKEEIKMKNDRRKKYEDEYERYMNESNSISSVLYDVFNSSELYKKVLDELLKNEDNELESDVEKNYIYRTTYFYRQNFIYKLAIEYVSNKSFDIEKFLEEPISSDKLIDKALKNDINKSFFDDRKKTETLKLIYFTGVGKYCADYIQSYFTKVNYIKPVRAHAERYYRLRNLSVEDIDSDGKNLPIFINSLNRRDLEKYNEWLYENFDFKVNPKQTDGHVLINIEKDNGPINISDTGYGYSQLLPIITQLWVILNNKLNSVRNEEVPIVFAVEQPELHLHPELQAKLIDAVCKIAKEAKNEIQFILETHSETMINRLGNLIYKNKISEDDVNIVMFEKEKEGQNTSVKISKFNKDGYLENWPIGFFSVDDIKDE